MKRLALKAEKNVAGKIATSAAAKSILDDDIASLLDAVESFVAKMSGAEEATEFRRNIMKVAVKIALLEKNDEFTPEDRKNLALLSDKFHTLLNTILTFKEVAFSYDADFIVDIIAQCRDATLSIARRHLTPKSVSRVETVFSSLNNRDHLQALFADAQYQQDLDSIYCHLKTVMDKNS